MGNKLAAEIGATVRANTHRRQRALETLALLADDRTRVAHAEELRAAGIAVRLGMATNDRALEYLRDLAQIALFERVMPPARTGADCSFRLPRYDTDWLRAAKDPTALYQFYDASGAVLYVGITWDPVSRFHQHSKKSKWWPLAARHTIRWYPDRLKAAEVEVRAVAREHPPYNSRLHTLTAENAMAPRRAIGRPGIPYRLPYRLIGTQKPAADVA